MTNKNDKLVFDLGMHNGDDSAYYLARGFDVVALEANPNLCEEGEKRHLPYKDRITIINQAFADVSGNEIDFFISHSNLEWSSTEEWRVLHSSEDATKVSVTSTNLQTLFDQFGLPHYIKCDLEGADSEFCKQLVNVPEKPDFISVEAISADWLAALSAAGYDRFQLVNQAKVRRFDHDLELSSRYGTMRYNFAGHCSGAFGYDLPIEKWISFSEAFDRWYQFTKLQAADPDMTLDMWFDFHATTLDVLNKPA